MSLGRIIDAALQCGTQHLMNPIYAMAKERSYYTGFFSFVQPTEG
jgi:hypothetical protein